MIKLSTRSLPAVAGLALLAAVCTPAAAQASPTTAASAAPVTQSALSTCNKVTTASMSSIMGFTVPAPAAQSAKETFVPAQNIKGTLVECTYGKTDTAAEESKAVLMGYAQLNKAATISEVQNVIKENLGGTSGAKVSTYKGLGVPAIYIVSGGEGIQVICAVKGSKLIISGISSRQKEAKLVGLTKLAVKAYL